MNKAFALAALVCVAMLTLQAAAAPFEPLFQVNWIKGDCTVKAPDAVKFVKAEDNKAYAYGSMIRTDKESSCMASLSADNTCTILADAAVTIGEDATQPTVKVVRIEKGRVEFKLAKDLQTYGGLRVETAATVAKATGTAFTVESGVEGELVVAVVAVSEGTLALSGAHYSVDTMDADDVVSVASAVDGSFTRLKVVKGKTAITIKDATGNPVTKELEAGQVVKIWRRAMETGEVAITTLIAAADGTLLADGTITYTETPAATTEPTAVTPTVVETTDTTKAPVAEEGAPKITEPVTEDFGPDGDAPLIPGVTVTPSVIVPATPTPVGER